MATLGLLVMLVAGQVALEPAPVQAVENEPAPLRRWSRNRGVAVLSTAGAVLVIGVGVWSWLTSMDHFEAAFVVNSQTHEAPASTAPDSDERFRVPSVGLDVAIGMVSEVDGQITPPGTESVYLVSSRGVSLEHADQGTVYIVAHSLPGPLEAPGDALVDEAGHRAALEKGARVEVGGKGYAVTGSEVVRVEDLPARGDIWENTPGRLIVITSLQPAGEDAAQENVVIVAQLSD